MQLADGGIVGPEPDADGRDDDWADGPGAPYFGAAGSITPFSSSRLLIRRDVSVGFSSS